LKNESQIALPKLFKSKTQTVDATMEIDGFINRKIVKKYKNFGGLRSRRKPYNDRDNLEYGAIICNLKAV